MKTRTWLVGVVASVLLAALAAVVGVPLASPAGAATAPNPLAGSRFWVSPGSAAAASAAADPAHAALYDKIARTARATWFTGGTPTQVRSSVDGVTRAAAGAGAVPVLVAYDIPRRDCGSYSGGGAGSASAYRAWISAFAAGLGGRKAVIVVEPDALAGLDCLSASERTTRLGLLSAAVGTIARDVRAVTYLDAGHAGWQPARVMAARLVQAGVRQARGFSLNVSNFGTTSTETAYGGAVAAAAGGAHFVVDTSRNGLGPAPGGAWCNPPGRALGARPTTRTGDARVDAWLWVKVPGESDGSCGPGQPSAGRWWPSYALGLAQRAAW